METDNKQSLKTGLMKALNDCTESITAGKCSLETLTVRLVLTLLKALVALEAWASKSGKVKSVSVKMSKYLLGSPVNVFFFVCFSSFPHSKCMEI